MAFVWAAAVVCKPVDLTCNLSIQRYVLRTSSPGPPSIWRCHLAHMDGHTPAPVSLAVTDAIHSFHRFNGAGREPFNVACRFDQHKIPDEESSELTPKRFSTVRGACVYVKVKCAHWAARHPRTPVSFVNIRCKPIVKLEVPSYFVRLSLILASLCAEPSQS